MKTKTASKGRGRAKKTLDMIDAIVEIAESIQPCNVRALAYQLFNRKLIPAMTKKYTQRVSDWCTYAREMGRLPWEWIVDSGRAEQSVPTWSNPLAYAKAVQKSYRRDKWADQPKHIVVWSEKATVEGTIRPVLEEYEVPFQVQHGWAGATPVWDAAQASLDRIQDTVILYVGDYDPSGLYMSEVDLPKRLARYSSDDPTDKTISLEQSLEELDAIGLEIRRISLTKADTVLLGEGPRFAAATKMTTKEKRGDSRYKWFVANHGHWCWELDALSPSQLRDRIEEAILDELDQEAWDHYVRVEEAEREAIIATCKSWGSI